MEQRPPLGSNNRSATQEIYHFLWEPNIYYQRGLLSFWTFSFIWYAKEHGVLETGSVSLLI
jgi:hypothetical protein